MNSLVSVISYLIGVMALQATAEKIEFSSNDSRPPVWLQGEYYTEKDGLFNSYLKVEPTLYI